ncbi:hypothetical protein HPB47_021898 [Ixodes persulcatus]|uniref:Uncharacterized protein n=1 Tax=Ixodes persulcatus TaxID=34615 RepID=A0AC60QB61_IXOPE|nr:hypothetical protein HPB47_021898 [Ixodes persulcatus]
MAEFPWGGRLPLCAAMMRIPSVPGFGNHVQEPARKPEKMLVLPSPLPCHPPLRATAGNTPSCWAGPAGCASSLRLPGVCAPDGGREQQRGWLTSGRGKMAAVVGPQRGAQLNQAS